MRDYDMGRAFSMYERKLINTASNLKGRDHADTVAYTGE
jgi:hypothetical protein